ncbi:MAG: S9 family peptidase [Acidobacteriaceae bacterium]|nr:S9 family peptidase [Acidobacteriaceae bacterium]MBV9778644.1 S9 family peptidase [Acidobacteriaceae bacterium]
MRLSVLLILSLNFALLHAADAPLPVPSNLKPDGLPEIPRALFDEVNRYNESRSAALLDWGPSRREILISTRFGDVPQLHRVAMPGGDRRQLTFFPDRVAGGLFNPANGDELVFAKDTGGGEFFQLYILDLRTGNITLLTKGGRSRNTGPVWSRDGKQIAYSSTARDGTNADIWLVEPRDPKSARILLQTSEPGWSVSDWSEDGKQILLTLDRSAVVSELYLLDVSSGRKTKLGPDAPDSGWFSAKFANDGKGAFVVSNANSDYRQLAYIDFAAKKPTVLRSDLHWDLDDLDVSRDGRYVGYLVDEGGYGKLHVFDARSRKDIALPDIPSGVISGLRWRPMGHEIGFTLASAHTPGDVYSLNIDTKQLDRWTYSETGGLNASQFPEPKLIHWKSFDGLSISGFLYPAAMRYTGARPVIIDIHGGPEGQFRPSYLGAVNYYMNELGVAVIFPNVRGSTGYGKTYLNLDNGMKREDSVKDIGALLDWIKAQPELDSNRIMVTGGSYGGYMTLATMTHYSYRVRCAVEQVGISNFRTFLEHTESYRRDLRRVEYGDERDPKMRDFFETISPLNNAAKITKPMFIVAGRNDPRVPYTEGQQMTEALRKNNVPVWYLLAEDEGHGFVKKRNRDFLAAATAEFVETYLLQREPKAE